VQCNVSSLVGPSWVLSRIASRYTACGRCEVNCIEFRCHAGTSCAIIRVTPLKFERMTRVPAPRSRHMRRGSVPAPRNNNTSQAVNDDTVSPHPHTDDAIDTHES
jgi:hypothetical protein